MEFEIKPLTPEDAEYIEKSVNEYIMLYTPTERAADAEEIVLKAENGDGETIGGSILEFGGFAARMQISMLWVDEHYRKQGLGSMLIRESERIAKEKGCSIACLCTLDFQAPDLYKKQGYAVYAVYEDRPRTHSVYYMFKRLDGDISSCNSKNNDIKKRFSIKTGNEADAGIIARGLKRHDDLFAPSMHETIRLNKKLVDKNGRLIAGIVAGVDVWDGCYVANLYVEQAYRNRGLGSHLLRQVELEAREKGAYMLVADACDLNVGFFKKNGCVEAGALQNEPNWHISYELTKWL